jgi:general secretion pathway protein G
MNLFNVFIGVSVLGAIAVSAVLLTTQCVSRTDGGYTTDHTRARIGALKTPLELYRQHVGVYPTTLNDLLTPPASPGSAARWAGPYVTNLDDLKDGWDHPFRYRAPGIKNPGQYDLWSIGPDGVDGTKDDISNW